MSVPRNDYLDEDMPDDAESPEEDSPACPIPSQPPRSPSSPGSPRPGTANQSYAPPQMSMPSWNMAKTMSRADGAGLKQIIAAAEQHWAWWCTPFVKKPVPFFVRASKVYF